MNDRQTTSAPIFRMRPLAQAMLCAALMGTATATHALPTGAEVSAGSGKVEQAGPLVTVRQDSPRLSLNWQSFAIGAGESVVFRQPSAQAIALNRVLGQDPSLILGNLSANGQVFLINPNGVLFGPGAHVDVGGIVASTLRLSDADFLAGRYTFSGDDKGSVVNRGTIRAADGGYVALLAPQVVNEGVITAQLGTVALGAGQQITLRIDGQSLVGFNVDRAAVGAMAANRRLIRADGGTVVLSAHAKDALVSTVVNNDGIVEARSVSVRNGVIRLEGGASGVVGVGGKLDATGANAGERGGRIEVTGEKVALSDGAVLDASGRAGGGSVLTGGDYQGRNPAIQNASRTYVAPAAMLRADAIDSGDGGKVIVWADGDTRFHGTASARGGSEGGDGGLVEISGKQQLAFDGRVDTSAARGAFGTLLLDPDDLTISAAPVGGALPDASNPFEAIDGANNYYVLAATLTALPAATAVVLQANNDIIFQTSLAMPTTAAGSITLTAANAIQMGGFNLSTANGSVSMSAGAGGITGLGTIGLGGGVLTLSSPGAITQNAGDIIQGGTALSKQGTGTLTLSGANTYTGATSIDAGTLRLGAANRIANTSAVTVASGATFDLNNFAETVGSIAGAGDITLGTAALGAGGDGTSTTWSGVVSGTGGLTKAGAGVLTLSGTNTYTGATTISAGTLRTVGGSAIADTSQVTLANVAGAALDLTADETIGNLSGGGTTGGNVTLGANTLTINQTGATTYTGIASGTGSVVKQGAGTLTLSGNNSYGGTTTINAGTLALGASNVLPNATGVIVDGGTLSLTTRSDLVAAVQLVSGSIASTSGVLTSSSDYDLRAGTVSAILGGAVDLVKSTAGTVVLSGNNTYTGATSIDAGTLRLGAANRIANTSAVTVASGATFDLNNFAETVGSIAGAGDITLGTAALSAGGDGTSTTWSGVVSGTGGLTKAGAGVLTLSGTNTYTGATTISAGTLRTVGGSAIADTSQVTLANVAGAALDLTADETIGNLSGGGTTGGNVTLGANTLTINQTGATTYTGIASGTGSVVKQGAGTLTLSGNNSYGGTTTINAGTLALGASNVLPNATGVIVDGGTLSLTTRSDLVAGVQLVSGSIASTSGVLTSSSDYDLRAGTVSAILGGAVDLVKSTAGTVVLSGNNTYTGATSIDAGTLRLGAANRIANTSAVTVASGATFDLNNFAETVGSIAGAGDITLGTATLSAGGDGTSTTWSGVVSGTGGLTKAGAGVLTLSGTNTYTGATTISAGTLRTVGGSAIADTSQVTLANVAGAALDLTADETIGNLSGGGTTGGNVTLGANTLTINQTGATTYTGIAGGTGSVVKQGAGTLTLSGNNSYTGATTISAGTLRLAAANRIANTSAVTVASGATFDLNNFAETVGSIAGAGSITLGSATLAAGGDGTSTTFSGTLSGSGGLTKAGAGVLTLSGTNTYSAVTTINAGTLRAANSAALGTTTAGTVVGSGAALEIANVAIGTEGLTLNGAGPGGTGALTGTGTAALGGAVTLASASTIAAPAASDSLALGGSINGAQALTQTGAGSVTFAGTVGATTPLASFASVTGSTTAISGGLLRTTGAQLYDGDLTTAGATTLRSAGSNVTASGVVNGAAGTITLDTGSGDVTMTNPSNDFGTVGVTSAGAVTLVDANGLALGAADLRALQARALGGDVTVDGPITATGAGDAIVLVAAGNFVNNSGASALDPGPGRFLVWSTDPALDNRGGLAYAFKQYAATYGVTPVAGAGNGFLYTLAPVVTASLTGSVTKVYDGTTAATLAPANYATSGAIDGDSVALNDPASGLYDTKDVGINKDVSVSGLAIAGASNGAVLVYGYQLASTTASALIGTITPATLDYLATPVAILQNAPFPPFTGTVTGFQGSDTIVSATTGTLAFATTAPDSTVAGLFPIDGSGLTALFGNYVFVQAPGNATALTIAPSGTPMVPGGSAGAVAGAIASAAAQSESPCSEVRAGGEQATLCGAQQNFRQLQQLNLVPGWRRVIELGSAALSVQGPGIRLPTETSSQ